MPQEGHLGEGTIAAEVVDVLRRHVSRGGVVRLSPEGAGTRASA